MFPFLSSPTLKQDPKSEYEVRNKLTDKQIKSEKSKTPNTKEVCFEVCIFQPFEFVSDFDIRIFLSACLQNLAPWRLCGTSAPTFPLPFSPAPTAPEKTNPTAHSRSIS